MNQESKSTWLGKLSAFRLQNLLTAKQFLLIVSILVGILSGVAAVVIKNSVHFISNIVQKVAATGKFDYLYIIAPAVGIFLAVLFIKFIIKRPVRHGIPNVLYSISKTNGHINKHNMFSSIVASSLTVGMGGSVGLEGPTVATGAAIGSNLGRFFKLNYKQITLLLGCACAGAMSAIFKAPVAAIVFAIEVIMIDLTMMSILPLLLASVSAVLTSYFFLGQNVLYPVDLKVYFTLQEMPFYIVLGILSGLVSVYFTKTYVFIGNIFDKMNNTYTKVLVGGLVLGILIAVFPTLYGEGYEDINTCLSGSYSYLFKGDLFSSFSNNLYVIIALLVIVIMLKVVASSITFGAGGVGGIFAPTLFMGVNTGFLFAFVINQITGNALPVSNFALAGMGGMIAGVLHAPLTAIFLIAELTGGYKMFVPLMVTSTFSYFIVKFFTSHSVYTIQLAKRKELITHDKDQAILTLMNVKSLIETEFSVISEDYTLGDLVKVVSKSTRNIFPVLDEEKNMKGVVFINDIRHVMFDTDKYDAIKVSDLMFMPDIVVDPDESMEEVARKFATSEHYNLPVLKDGKYVGFVSRANVFSSYREKLRDFSNYDS